MYVRARPHLATYIRVILCAMYPRLHNTYLPKNSSQQRGVSSGVSWKEAFEVHLSVVFDYIPGALFCFSRGVFYLVALAQNARADVQLVVFNSNGVKSVSGSASLYPKSLPHLWHGFHVSSLHAVGGYFL